LLVLASAAILMILPKPAIAACAIRPEIIMLLPYSASATTRKDG